MARLAVGTIVAKNYLSYARVLARSFRRRHPDVPFSVLLADEIDGRFEPAAEPYRLLSLEDLAIPALERFRFRFSRQQMLVASKPHLLRHLLDAGADTAVYLDGDILVTGDMSPIFEQAREASIALTPHLLSPLDGDRRAERELSILRSGVYNGGFVSVSATSRARAFLQWWEDRMNLYCRHDPAAGIHNDQRWLDLASSFFSDVHVIRDPGCNVAYWNLPERAVEVRGEEVLVAGDPCRFFHFSGFRPDVPDAATRHVQGLTISQVGGAAELFHAYAALLRGEGYAETERWPYAYAAFDNGVPIPGVAREEYAEMGAGAEAFGDPFVTAPADSYFRWLRASGEDGAGSPRSVSRLWDAVYRRRQDVQRAFPDHRGADRDAFLGWARSSGAAEHGIPEALRTVHDG